MFKNITVRTAAGQTKPRQGLLEVGKNQVAFAFESVRGTMICFRQPHYMQGIGIAGDHLHFITDDRKRGGHVLAFESDGEIEIKVAKMYRMTLELPRDDEEFNEAELLGNHKDLESVEG